jgi:ribonuclease I
MEFDQSEFDKQMVLSNGQFEELDVEIRSDQNNVIEELQACMKIMSSTNATLTTNLHKMRQTLDKLRGKFQISQMKNNLSRCCNQSFFHTIG